jgi:hypothetical protein
MSVLRLEHPLTLLCKTRPFVIVEVKLRSKAMGIRKFFSSDSQSKKPLEASSGSEHSTALPNSRLAGKNNVVSIVEHKFKRMDEAHDRIRTALLASHSQNSR